MKKSYVYEAEYISEVNGEHFLNIDLGFQTWYVTSIKLDNEEDLTYGDKLLIETCISGQKPHNYTGKILK